VTSRDETGLKQWRQLLPGDAALADAGVAYGAGHYARALELVEQAKVIAAAAGDTRYTDLADNFAAACRAKLSGQRAVGEVPEGCALCGSPELPGEVLPIPFIYFCGRCLPLCRSWISELRSRNALQAHRFAAETPGHPLCPFGGIGPLLLVVQSLEGVTGVCYECLEDFTDVVHDQREGGA
jgi:hypothetical protein